MGIIYFSVGMSVVLITLKLMKSGLKDLMTPLCLFYFYFAFGPVINYLFGYNIYFGIPQEYIPGASLIFLTALSTMVIGSFLWPERRSGLFFPKLNLNALAPIYLISVLYAIYVIVMVFISGADNKIAKIGIANPALHYNYLLLQLYLISFFFLLKNGVLKKLYFTNTIFYILYSLVIGERDFIFPVFSLLFHRSAFDPDGKRSNWKLIGAMVAMMFIATGVFFIRDASQASEGVLSSILNQGSLLFVNTFSLKLLHERIDYFLGFTYFNSFLNLLPDWIYKTDFNTLDWFKNSYAEASTSGYGFGMDAEGFINFSYFGVFLAFFIILVCERKIVKHLGKHPFFTYYSVFFTSFTMYSFRNDSLAFLKGNLYATIFFFLIYKLSWKKGEA
ncbi:MAG: O-antigen polymerase [Bacteriovoracia bacterium]